MNDSCDARLVCRFQHIVVGVKRPARGGIGQIRALEVVLAIVLSRMPASTFRAAPAHCTRNTL